MQDLVFCKGLDSFDQCVYKVEKRKQANSIHALQKSNMSYILHTSEGATAGSAVAMRLLACPSPVGLSRKAIPQRRSEFKLQHDLRNTCMTSCQE